MRKSRWPVEWVSPKWFLGRAPSRDFLEQASRNFTPRMDDVIPASPYNPEGSIKSEGILGDSHSVRQQRAVAFEGLANEQQEAARRHSTWGGNYKRILDVLVSKLFLGGCLRFKVRTFNSRDFAFVIRVLSFIGFLWVFWTISYLYIDMPFFLFTGKCNLRFKGLSVVLLSK